MLLVIVLERICPLQDRVLPMCSCEQRYKAADFCDGALCEYPYLIGFLKKLSMITYACSACSAVASFVRDFAGFRSAVWIVCVCFAHQQQQEELML